MWNTISWCVIQWLHKQFTSKYDQIMPLIINKRGVFQIFFDLRNWEKRFSKLTMYWWKKKIQILKSWQCLDHKLNEGMIAGIMYLKGRPWCFLMQHMRALKIFKPIYTLRIKSWHFRNYRFFGGKCHDFPNPCTNKSRAERRKKEYFFSKVWNQGRDCSDS